MSNSPLEAASHSDRRSCGEQLWTSPEDWTVLLLGAHRVENVGRKRAFIGNFLGISIQFLTLTILPRPTQLARS